MENDKQCRNFGAISIELTDEDIMSAMKDMTGYIDITSNDFREIYKSAYTHAIQRLGQSVTAQDIMTKTVIVVNPDTDLIETATRMAENDISGVPVINSENIVLGVISEKDFLRKMEAHHTGSFMSIIAECLSNKGCLAIPIRKKTARDIMTSPAITARPNSTIFELSRMMAENNINRIPITTANGNLLGIVSRDDLIGSWCAKLF